MSSQDKHDPYGLQPAWGAILDVYRAFAEICGNHGFRYWGAYGTVLGAVRHKGFIPWDDDFDVLMPREDYDKFLSICEKELPSYLKLVTMANTPEFNYNIAKIQDSRREKVEEVERRIGRPMPQGIYIDIFPLDGYVPSKTPLAGRFWSYVVKFRRAWLTRKLYPPHPRNKYLFAMGFLCGILLPTIHSKEDFYRWYEEKVRCHSFDEAPSCLFFDPTYNRQRIHKRNVFATTSFVPFEDIKIPIPGGFADYLSIEYGPDYMTPPPEEKRISNHEESLEASWKYGPTNG